MVREISLGKSNKAYKKRLKMCKDYPVKKLHFPVVLHEGYGYKVRTKEFSQYLEDVPEGKK